VANFKLKESADKVSAGTTLAGVNIIPQAGFIMPFAGTTAPSGWALCDGTNGTPDLRGFFIIGATSSGNIGGTTGSNNHTHNYTFSNINVSLTTNVANHSAAIVDNVMSAAGAPVSHSHTYSAGVTTPNHSSGNFINWSNGNTTTRSARVHRHSGTTSTMTTSAVVGSGHVHNRSSGTITNGTITETSHTHTVLTSPSGVTSPNETIAGNIIMNYIMKL
jgi:hypothetical protein